MVLKKANTKAAKKRPQEEEQQPVAPQETAEAAGAETTPKKAPKKVAKKAAKKRPREEEEQPQPAAPQEEQEVGADTGAPEEETHHADTAGHDEESYEAHAEHADADADAGHTEDTRLERAVAAHLSTITACNARLRGLHGKADKEQVREACAALLGADSVIDVLPQKSTIVSKFIVQFTPEGLNRALEAGEVTVGGHKLSVQPSRMAEARAVYVYGLDGTESREELVALFEERAGEKGSVCCVVDYRAAPHLPHGCGFVMFTSVALAVKAERPHKTQFKGRNIRIFGSSLQQNPEAVWAHSTEGPITHAGVCDAVEKALGKPGKVLAFMADRDQSANAHLLLELASDPTELLKKQSTAPNPAFRFELQVLGPRCTAIRLPPLPAVYDTPLAEIVAFYEQGLVNNQVASIERTVKGIVIDFVSLEAANRAFFLGPVLTADGKQLPAFREDLSKQPPAKMQRTENGDYRGGRGGRGGGESWGRGGRGGDGGGSWGRGGRGGGGGDSWGGRGGDGGGSWGGRGGGGESWGRGGRGGGGGGEWGGRGRGGSRGGGEGSGFRGRGGGRGRGDGFARGNFRGNRGRF